MTRIRLIVCTLVAAWLSATHIQAQDAKKEAYSIVESSTEMICESATNAIWKESRTIIVLNEKGKNAADFLCMCDKFMSLNKFSGEILDFKGGPIRKIKKSELQMSEYSSGLTSDDYYYFYECNPPSYPFTVKYEWEVKCKNGLIGYPTFMPQSEYNQTVLKATYRLKTPASSECRYRVVNSQAKVKQSKTPDGGTLMEVDFELLPPIEKEPFGEPLRNLIPYIFFAPSNFVFDGSHGKMSNWKEYGDWQYGLLAGREQLPDAVKAKLRELTANCTTPREKVKAVYDHLSATTRYVSIQLGIGGWQPIAAADVCRTGFGDCKGLSNYTRAMLAELGIDSRYTIISTNNARLLPDFSNLNQMNHVILQVPLPQDTLWLECTNPQLPFGYVHSSIAGHDALLIGPDGGKIYRLPTYPDSLNTQVNNAHVVLSPTGEAKIENRESSRLFQYEDNCGITRLEPAKQKDRLRAYISLAQADISQVRVSEKKTASPQLDIQYTISSNQYGNKTGNRLFIPINVFRKGFNIPESKQRTQPVHINNGYLDTDSIRIQLPEGYVIEALPRSQTKESKFGTFHSTIQVEGREVRIVQQLLMKKGVYPKESYPDFADFRKQIAGQYSAKIILRKE